ncbi:TetR/AcrR family transcriptional regulator [Leifsonia shinshuensis]|uniref:TetR/AcrR family transcriptional regulator n=1 Tax=Leifsonia shinshuensis TaxID=150026 RepID=UPI001F50E0D9|nr:TetR/AcrR family transcriptional regulator [Leifsonia shinshuensis]MCI0157319.1 TetR/AcrR family transcriptional regulator [Leifsonia shinshuensis]
MSQATFSRARSEEQRAQRREAILSAAAEMLVDTRVAELSLNELARRVGLAKSNVLRYFESREAVLLELYGREFAAWLDALEARLAALAAHTPESLAAAVADTAAERPVFAELCAAAPGILEHNISGPVARDYKRALLAHVARLGALASPWIGEDQADVLLFVGTVTLGIGGIWSTCRLSPGMAEAYRLDPELAGFRVDFRESLEVLLVTVVRGLRAA